MSCTACCIVGVQASPLHDVDLAMRVQCFVNKYGFQLQHHRRVLHSHVVVQYSALVAAVRPLMSCRAHVQLSPERHLSER